MIKKNRKRMLALALVIALNGSLIQGNNSDAISKNKDVYLKSSTAKLNIVTEDGKTKLDKTTIKVKSKKGIKIKKISYKIKNKKIAKVNKKGVVTPQKKGKTYVTVRVSYVKKNKNKKVNLKYKVEVAKIKKNNKTVTPTQTAMPTQTVTPTQTAMPTETAMPTQEPGEKATTIKLYQTTYVTYKSGNNGINPVVVNENEEDASVVYSVEDESIATVDENGTIFGIATGTTTGYVQAKDGSSDKVPFKIIVLDSQYDAEAVDDFFSNSTAGIIQRKVDEHNETYNVSLTPDEYEYRNVYEFAVGNYDKINGFHGVIRTAIRNEINGKNEPGTSSDVIGTYYQSLVNVSNRANVLDIPYFETIDQVDSISKLMAMAALVDKDGVESLVSSNAIPAVDEDNPTNLCVALTAPSVFLTEDIFANKDESEEYAAFYEYIKGAMALIYPDLDGQDIEKKAKSIINAAEIMCTKEADLINDSMDENEKIEALKANERTQMGIEEFNKKYPNIDIKSFLKNVGYSDVNEVFVVDAKRMEVFNKLIGEDYSVFLDYSKFLIADSMSYVLDKDFNNVVNSYSEMAYGEEMNSFSDDETALTESEAESKVRKQLAWDISKVFTDKYVDESNKDVIAKIYENLCAEYRTEMSNCNWMSEESKKGAIEKLDKLKLFNCYPDNYEDYVCSNILSDEATALENYIKIRSSEKKQNIAIAGKNLKKDNIWFHELPPTTYNCSYIPNFNCIIVYGAFVVDSAYNKDESDAYNYGTIGVAIGHEIGHAFDNTGVLFDATGRQRMWMDEDNQNSYNEIAKKLTKYYNSYYVTRTTDGKTHFCNGEMTLGESMADIASLACMFSIFNDKNDRLDLIRGYSEQYAQTDKDVKQNYYSSYKKDVHPIEKIRVNATLSLFDEIYDVLDIKEGDGMYIAPDKRIRIWK